MSVNKKPGLLYKTAAAFLFSTLCGTAASAILLILFTGVMYGLGLPPSIAGALSFAAFAAGCALSGFICGIIRQHRGLKIGAVCALLMILPLIAVSALSGNLTGAGVIPKLITALCSSCIGSVIGVNRKRRPV